MDSESILFSEKSDVVPVFQKEAEAGLNELIQVGGFEAAFLYSVEGLPLAHSYLPRTRLTELQVVELVIMIAKMARVMQKLGAIDTVHELFVENRQGAKVVFRLLNVFGQPAMLVLLVPAQKAYRGLTNRVAKVIEKWSAFAE
jgi:hypothetical protein